MEKLLFSVTVDVEPDFGIPGPAGQFSHLVRGTANLIGLFGQIGIKTTFFVTKIISDRFPEEVRKIGLSQEVGVHGYEHECWGRPKWWLGGVRVLKLEEKRNLLARSVESLEDLVSRAPRSFRAPYLVADSETLKLLDEFGFEVDSSAPTYLGVPPEPYHPDGLSLVEIPVSADPRPRPEIFPIPHFRFDSLNMKLLAQRGVDWCVNFVKDIISYQLGRDINPHIVMLTHQWEFAGAQEVPDKSFEYAMGDNLALLRDFLSAVRNEFKVKFVTMEELAKVVA